MDKKAIAAYWTLASLMSKADPEKATTPEAKQLFADFHALHDMYVSYMNEVNCSNADESEMMDANECVDMMLGVVQEFISRHSSSPAMTKRAALAWKTLLSKMQR